jgi:hypothetical protein
LILIRPSAASIASRVARAPPLEPLAAGDPGVEAVQRPLERQHLAQRAAAIGIAPPKVAGAVFAGEVLGERHHRAQVGQAERGREPVAVGQGFGEILAGLEKDHRQVAVDPRHHVEEQRRVGAERGDHGESAGEQVPGGDRQQRLGAQVAEAPVEYRRVPRRIAARRPHGRHPEVAVGNRWIERDTSHDLVSRVAVTGPTRSSSWRFSS